MQYPTLKVILCFTLCPIIPAPVISTAILYNGVPGFMSIFEGYYWLPAYAGMTLWFAVCALIFFGVPSLMLAVACATLQLSQCVKHVFFVSLSGGALALMFNGLFLPPIHETAAFIAGMVTSLLAAFISLPEQDTKGSDSS